MPSCLACSCLCWASSSIQSEKGNCGKYRPPRKPKPGQTLSFGVTLLGSKRQSETRGSRVRSFNGGRSSFCFNLERRMIDHIGISVGSIARATAFYLKALAPLGYGIVMEVSAEETGHGAAIAFGAPGRAADFQSGKPSFWVGESAKASGRAPGGV